MKIKFAVLTFFVVSLAFVLCGAGCGNIAAGSDNSYNGGNSNSGGGGYPPPIVNNPSPVVDNDPVTCPGHQWSNWEYIGEVNGKPSHRDRCSFCAYEVIEQCDSSQGCNNCKRKLANTNTNYDATASFIPINENIKKIVIVANDGFKGTKPVTDYIKHKENNYTIVDKYYPTGTRAEDIRQELKTEYLKNPNMCVLIMGRGTNINPYSIPEFVNNNQPRLEGKIRYAATDFYYGYYKDGKTDLFPDVAVGRLSATSVAELQAQVDKIIATENNPPTNNNIVLVQHKTSAGTTYFSDEPRDIRKYLEGNFSGKYQIEETFTTDPNGINNAIKAGSLLVSYTGHGRTDSWGDSTYNTNTIKTLQNSFYPIVLGVTCNSANFTAGDECVAEAFMRKSQGGAVGYIGASAAMISYYSKAATIGNDNVPGMINSLIYSASNKHGGENYKVKTLGGLFLAALRSIKMSKTYYNSLEYKDYSIEVLNLFGDPTMSIDYISR